MKTSRRSRKIQSARAGFTIIEIIVAMTGLILIGGIVLQIYDETQSAAQKMMNRQSAIDFAVSFLDQSSEQLRNAVRPGDLDVEVQPAFTSDRFSVPAYGDPASNGLFLVTVRPSEGDEGRPYEIAKQPLAVAGGDGAEGESVSAFGPALNTGEPNVAFRYATEARPGEVAYVDRLAPGQWPVLVEISVEVPTGAEGEDPIRMKTAVIPGRIGPMAAVAPTPTPTPVPAANLRQGRARNNAAPPVAAQDAPATTATAEAQPTAEAAPTEAAP